MRQNQIVCSQVPLISWQAVGGVALGGVPQIYCNPEAAQSLEQKVMQINRCKDS